MPFLIPAVGWREACDSHLSDQRSMPVVECSTLLDFALGGAKTY